MDPCKCKEPKRRLHQIMFGTVLIILHLPGLWLATFGYGKAEGNQFWFILNNGYKGLRSPLVPLHLWDHAKQPGGLGPSPFADTPLGKRTQISSDRFPFSLGGTRQSEANGKSAKSGGAISVSLPRRHPRLPGSPRTAQGNILPARAVFFCWPRAKWLWEMLMGSLTHY